MSVKDRLYTALEGRPGGGLTAVQRLSAMLIVVSVIFAIVASEPVVQILLGATLRTIELTFGLLFATEYVLRAYAVGANPAYRGVPGLMRHLVRPMSVVDLVSILPFFLGVGSEAFVVRMVRLFRLIALSRLARYSSAMSLVVQSVYSRRHELILSLCMAFCMMLLSASALYAAEAETQPEHFGSIPRALWWSVSTLTTVGYGDVVPVTVVGKFCAAITAISGIGLIAMPTGILAAAFSDAFAAARARATLGKADKGDA